MDRNNYTRSDNYSYWGGLYIPYISFPDVSVLNRSLTCIYLPLTILYTIVWQLKDRKRYWKK